jgi:hypothetical protein
MPRAAPVTSATRPSSLIGALPMTIGGRSILRLRPRPRAIVSSAQRASRRQRGLQEAGDPIVTSLRFTAPGQGRRSRITEVPAPTTCDVPLPRPIIMGDLRYDSREYLVVEVATDTGATGHRCSA